MPMASAPEPWKVGTEQPRAGVSGGWDSRSQNVRSAVRPGSLAACLRKAWSRSEVVVAGVPSVIVTIPRVAVWLSVDAWTTGTRRVPCLWASSTAALTAVFTLVSTIKSQLSASSNSPAWA